MRRRRVGLILIGDEEKGRHAATPSTAPTGLRAAGKKGTGRTSVRIRSGKRDEEGGCRYQRRPPRHSNTHQLMEGKRERSHPPTDRWAAARPQIDKNTKPDCVGEYVRAQFTLQKHKILLFFMKIH